MMTSPETAAPSNSLPLLPGRTLAVGLAMALTCAARLSGFEPAASGEDKAKPVPESRQEDVPRIFPREPNEAIKTFHTTTGFRMDLIAQEPLVTSPVAMTY